MWPRRVQDPHSRILIYRETAQASGWEPTADNIQCRHFMYVAPTDADVADWFKFAALTFLQRDEVARHVDALRIAVGAAGRDVERFGIEVRMIAQATTSAEWNGVIRWANDLGVSHFSFANRIVGGSLDEQIETCRQFVDETREWR